MPHPLRDNVQPIRRLSKTQIKPLQNNVPPITGQCPTHHKTLSNPLRGYLKKKSNPLQCNVLPITRQCLPITRQCPTQEVLYTKCAMALKGSSGLDSPSSSKAWYRVAITVSGNDPVHELRRYRTCVASSKTTNGLDTVW